MTQPPTPPGTPPTRVPGVSLPTRPGPLALSTPLFAPPGAPHSAPHSAPCSPPGALPAAAEQRSGARRVAVADGAGWQILEHTAAGWRERATLAPGGGYDAVRGAALPGCAPDGPHAALAAFDALLTRPRARARRPGQPHARPGPRAADHRRARACACAADAAPGTRVVRAPCSNVCTVAPARGVAPSLPRVGVHRHAGTLVCDRRWAPGVCAARCITNRCSPTGLGRVDAAWVVAWMQQSCFGACAQRWPGTKTVPSAPSLVSIRNPRGR
ncbi:hypothetical protein GCM10010841_26040 [Deinococcus aerophilus]|uniref:Uncharacterized protein n=1 Tax=Deinococcus aerophilus TaxID=522488 RepID=A0ABQ2GXW7_9DEIO|nr:hypothetical protein GCM10010841_26040 [Deinococcus aerophilus]